MKSDKNAKPIIAHVSVSAATLPHPRRLGIHETEKGPYP